MAPKAGSISWFMIELWFWFASLSFGVVFAILIYPGAQSRTAARKELLDQATSPDECEKLYDESLWCLYALQDDLLQTGNPFMDEDRETIATCTSCIITIAALP